MTAQQTVTTREVAWALRWMRRGRGLSVMLLYAVLVSGEIVAMIHTGRLRGADRQQMFNVVFALQIASLLLAVGTWMYFLSRRSFAPFRSGRLGDLLASPLAPRELWPGMLWGPAVIATGFAVLAQGLNLAIPLLAGEPHYLVYTYLRSPSSMEPEHLHWVRVVTLIRAPIMVLSALALAMTYGALAAVLVLPGGGSGRLVGVLALGLVVLVPEIAMAIWVDNSAVMSDAVAQRFQLISDHVTGPIITLLIAGVVYGLSLRVLRGARFQTRLARCVERL